MYPAFSPKIALLQLTSGPRGSTNPTRKTQRREGGEISPSARLPATRSPLSYSTRRAAPAEVAIGANGSPAYARRRPWRQGGAARWRGHRSRPWRGQGRCAQGSRERGGHGAQENEGNSERAPATVRRARRSWRRGGGETPDWALPSRTRWREQEHGAAEDEAELEPRGIWRGWSSGGAWLRRACGCAASERRKRRMERRSRLRRA
jgi:hypothetical protein